MNDREPESARDAAPEDFEVEISALSPEDDGQVSAPLRVLPGTPLSPGARARRVIAASLALLALLVILGSNAAWRREALGLLFSAPAPTAALPMMRLPALLPTPQPADWQLLLERPLRLPGLKSGSPCPVTRGSLVSRTTGVAVGNGPVYAIFGDGSAAAGVLQYQDGSFLGPDGASDWNAQAVAWAISPDYTGAALIRGGQIDGSSALRFNGGVDQQNFVGAWSREPLLPALRLIGSSDGATWSYWGTYTRLRGPGCYAYQVDGFTFSYIIIFRALPEDGR